MRTITFDADDDTDVSRFSLLYTAFAVGGAQIPNKGIEGTMLDADLFKKFAAISDRPTYLDDSIKGVRVLRRGGQTLSLTEIEHSMLVRYYRATSWTPEAAQRAVEVWTWLNDLPAEKEYENKPDKKKKGNS